VKTVALVGTPNSGKTTLFNRLTRSRQRVANVAGVTVDGVEGVAIGKKGQTFSVLDLPGAYSLRPTSDEERVTVAALSRSPSPFDAIVLVLDATQLWRNLGFALEVLALGRPVLVILNMMDLATKRRLAIDISALSKQLNCRVLPMSAVRKEGFDLLVDEVGMLLDSTETSGRNAPVLIQSSTASANEVVLERFKRVDQIYKTIVGGKFEEQDLWSRRIDRVILHPVVGPILLLVVLSLVFQLVFNVAQIPAGWIESGFGFLSDFVRSHMVDGFVRDLLTEGVLAGVGGTLVFLPQILILFTAILFLEDFGYMARAVVILDSWMVRVGLHGQSFLPLLSSFACAIPGVMAARAIDDRKDRIVTILVAPLMTCSARLPVYALLIAAFVPNRTLLPGVGLQGVVMSALYFVAVVAGLLVGALFKKFLLHGDRRPLLIELPSYKPPSLTSLASALWFRAKTFLRRVTTIIVALTVALWVLTQFPKNDLGEVELQTSYAGRLGHAIEPVIRPLGFDWKIGMILVPAFAAREVVVSALATTLKVEDEESELGNITLIERLQGEWSIATGLSLLVWFIFAPQCISTMAVVRRETGSIAWVVVMVGYLFALAYMASLLTYRFVLLFS
jgi:ferrous iron transport protein B